MVYSLYGGYGPAERASNVQRMMGNTLFGRGIGLLDHTPYISEPEQQSWRASTLQNFLPNYQAANAAFRRSGGRIAPGAYPHSPYAVLPDAGVAATGNPPFPMHPGSPDPGLFAPYTPPLGAPPVQDATSVSVDQSPATGEAHLFDPSGEGFSEADMGIDNQANFTGEPGLGLGMMGTVASLAGLGPVGLGIGAVNAIGQAMTGQGVFGAVADALGFGTPEVASIGEFGGIGGPPGADDTAGDPGPGPGGAADIGDMGGGIGGDPDADDTADNPDVGEDDDDDPI